MAFKLVRTGRSFNERESIDMPFPAKGEAASRITKALGMPPVQGNPEIVVNHSSRATRLMEALQQKEKGLTLRKTHLASPYHADDDWTKEQIAYLESQIAEIRRYLDEGGSLSLPRCCIDPSHICMIAVKGYNACFMSPDTCGFSIRPAWRKGGTS